MTTRIKNVLVFCAALLLAAGVYVWFYPLNKGILSVSTDAVEYLIITDEKNVECLQNPCVLPFKTGLHNIQIQKDGFFPETIQIEIKRGETNNVSVQFKKIPSLNESDYLPADETKLQKSIPEALGGLSVLAPAWDQMDSNLAFIDQQDDRLKILDSDENIKTIVALKNISDGFKLYWSPDSKCLFGTEGSDIYFINVAKASRKKNILGFAPRNVTWALEGGYLFINDDENNLYKIDMDEEKIEPLAIEFDLSNSVWDEDNFLVSFIYNSEENKATIESFNPVSNEKKEILVKYNFPVTKITSDENKKVYLYNSELEKWYELDY